MEILQKADFIRDDPIKVLRSSRQQRQKRCMDEQETLGLENLGLEKPAAPRNICRATKAKGRRAENKASLHSDLQQASEKHTSSISSWDPSTVPSYQTPIGVSAGTLNQWPSQDHSHGLIQSSPAAPRCHPVQTSLSLPGPPSVSRYQPEALTPINGLSTFTRVTAAPLVHPKPPFRGPEPTVHKSKLSVLTCRVLPSSRVDK